MIGRLKPSRRLRRQLSITFISTLTILAIIALLWMLAVVWPLLTVDQKFALAGLIFTIIGLYIGTRIGLSSLQATQRQLEAEKQFPYDTLPVEELSTKSGVLPAKGGRVEPYIERKEVKAQLAAGLIPKSHKLLIYGPSGVGKTREAVEIIKRLCRLEESTVYFAQSLEVPTELPRELPRRNIIVFIDDLNVRLERHKARKGDDDQDIGSLEQRLAEAIRFFEDENKGSKTQEIHVILTAQAKDYRTIEKSFPSLLQDFSVVGLGPTSTSSTEKKAYIKSLVDLFRFEPVEDRLVDALVAAGTESLRDLYHYFSVSASEGKTHIDLEWIEELKANQKEVWKHRVLPGLSDNERLIFEALAKLKQFAVPAHLDLLLDLCIFKQTGFHLFKKSALKKSLINLEYNGWLTVSGKDKISCHESQLVLRQPGNNEYENDLKLLLQVADDLAKKRKWSELYRLLMPVATSLGVNEMRHKSIELYNQLLTLPDSAFPGDVRGAKSQILFHKGYNFYSLDKRHWKEAELCYKQSIELNDRNLFAKHALAMLHQKQGKPLEALKLLDEITDKSPKDILSYKTKLDIYIDTGTEPEKAKKTYLMTKRLLRTGHYSSRSALVAESACVRYLAKIGELLKEAGDDNKAKVRLAKAIVQYEKLINKIPSSENDIYAVVRNSYGCFLYDVMDRADDAIAQLEAACKAWSEHWHSFHKLATIYLAEAEVMTTDRLSYINKARRCLNVLIKFDAQHKRSRLTLAKLEAESIQWSDLQEHEFWKQASDIYKKYEEAYEESSSHTTLHNAIVHHDVGCFLWRLEAVAHQRRYSQKPSSLTQADVELTKSIDITNSSRRICNHLIIAHFTLGAYYLKVAQLPTSDNPTAISQKGQSHIKIASDMAQRAGLRSPENSYLTSYIGKQLRDAGDLSEAKTYLSHAVSIYEHNWRAWWFLGGVHELNGDLAEAYKCFKTAAEEHGKPLLYGQLRGIVKQWMDDKEQSSGLNNAVLNSWQLECSERAYELDPHGDLNPKNLSDYGYDLYKTGESTLDYDTLKQAKELLLMACSKYIEAYNNNQIADMKPANFPLWYAGECEQLIHGDINEEALNYYLEAAVLRNTGKSYNKLLRKIQYSGIYEMASKCLIGAIAHYPDQHQLYRLAGVVLAENGEYIKALPYLQQCKVSGDEQVLRALIECYCEIGEKSKAEELCEQLYALLSDYQKAKLKGRARQLGLRCG